VICQDTAFIVFKKVEMCFIPLLVVESSTSAGCPELLTLTEIKKAGIIAQCSFNSQPATSLSHQKHRIAKQQFAVFPKAAENRIVDHIDYRAAAHILHAKQQAVPNFC